MNTYVERKRKLRSPLKSSQAVAPVSLPQRSEKGVHLLAYLRQLIAIAMFFLIGIIISPMCWAIWKFFGRQVTAVTGQKFIRQLFCFYVWWLKVTGVLQLKTVNMEKMDGLQGTVIVSNHPALLDAIFLISQLPPTACVMRANLIRNPALRGSALLAGYVTNDSGPSLVRQGMKKVRRGGNLLVFPEGTRTISQTLNRFKPGFGLVAVHTGASVQTILIDYQGTYLRKGVSLFKPAALPLRFTIRCGERLTPHMGESAREFSDRVEKWYRGQLQGAGNNLPNNYSLA